MTCQCCKDARDWPGTVAARRYVQNCIWCGARYIKLVPKNGRTRDGRPFTRDEAVAERRRIMQLWTSPPWGHSEAEIRRLVQSDELPLEPAPEIPSGKKGSK